MFNPNQKYVEMTQYRAEAERSAQQRRLVRLAREAQRAHRHQARFVALRSAQARLLTLVGRALVAWGTRLQDSQTLDTHETTTCATSRLRP